MVLAGLSSDQLQRKLAKIPIVQEPGRKLWLHDLLSSQPVPWAKMKQGHRTIRPIKNADVNLETGKSETDAGDTFRPLKSAYTQFRSTGAPDCASDDVIGIICPGECRNRPANETLERCFRSLRLLVPEHQEPKIGVIEIAQPPEADSVRQLFARKIEHHFVFTSQASPRQEGGAEKDALLEWPHQCQLVACALDATKPEVTDDTV